MTNFTLSRGGGGGGGEGSATNFRITILPFCNPPPSPYLMTIPLNERPHPSLYIKPTVATRSSEQTRTRKKRKEARLVRSRDPINELLRAVDKQGYRVTLLQVGPLWVTPWRNSIGCIDVHYWGVKGTR